MKIICELLRRCGACCTDELMMNAARLIREVIGRDLNKRRRFGMYQDQTDDLWKVVDMLEAAAKAKRAKKGGEA